MIYKDNIQKYLASNSFTKDFFKKLIIKNHTHKIKKKIIQILLILINKSYLKIIINKTKDVKAISGSAGPVIRNNGMHKYKKLIRLSDFTLLFIIMIL